ncbi:uncharacterized protein BcabD6B2_40880 [Babesia caballi]|uniref:Uncharacterized protein n=1 Tax=Babesia caballi TaxID=5871 RepID=A0AAV4LY51_BABCB|nr:hypothetical protein, conserved [Babesia caballi]
MPQYSSPWFLLTRLASASSTVANSHCRSGRSCLPGVVSTYEAKRCPGTPRNVRERFAPAPTRQPPPACSTPTRRSGVADATARFPSLPRRVSWRSPTNVGASAGRCAPGATGAEVCPPRLRAPARFSARSSSALYEAVPTYAQPSPAAPTAGAAGRLPPPAPYTPAGPVAPKASASRCAFVGPLRTSVAPPRTGAGLAATSAMASVYVYISSVLLFVPGQPRLALDRDALHYTHPYIKYKINGCDGTAQRGAPSRIVPPGAPGVQRLRRGQHQLRVDGHGHQLLNQQLARVGNRHLRNLRLVVAGGALEVAPVEVGNAAEPAPVADVHPEGVALVEEPLLEHLGRAVRDHAVALHLAEAQPAVPGAPLGGLPRQHRHRPPGAGVDLVLHHVLEPLVVGGPDEDLAHDHLAGEAAVQRLVAVLAVAALEEPVRHLLHRQLGEGRRVALHAAAGADLPHEALDQVADGHAAGHGVGVHDDVRVDALAGEGHVLRPVGHPDGALLPVPAGELVADLRHPDGPDLDLGELGALGVGGEQHRVDHAVLARPQAAGAVHPQILVLLVVARRRPPDDNVVAQHPAARLHQPVGVELRVVPPLHADARRGVRPLEPLDHRAPHVLLLAHVRPVERAPKQPPVDRGLVHDETVLLVVPRVTHDGHYGVDARGQLPEPQELHGSGAHQRLLRVVEQVAQRVHPEVEVGRVHPHGLLAHGALVRVARRLVLVGEGDDGGADAQNHGRVDLAVRVGAAVAAVRLEVLREHGDHAHFLLLAVDVLNHPRLDQPVPVRLVVVQPRNVLLRYRERVAVFHDEQRPHRPPRVGEDLDLLRHNVAHDARLRRDVAPSPELQQSLHQALRLVEAPHPRPVDEHLDPVLDHLRRHLVQRVHAPLAQKLVDRRGRGTHADEAHERQVLHQPDRLPLRRLGRAYHAPMRVVQLPGLRHLALPPQRSVEPAQVGQIGRKGEPVQNLADPSAHHLALPVPSPVARQQLVLHPLRDLRRAPHRPGHIELPAGVNLLLQDPLGVLDHLPEERAEARGHQRPREVKPLLPEVVPVVLNDPAQPREQYAVHHVPQEVALLALAPGLRAHVRQQVLPQQVPRVLNPGVQRRAHRGPTLPDEVEADLLRGVVRRLLQRRPHQREHLLVLEVVHNPLQNVPVGDAAERPEQDCDGDVGLEVGQGRHELAVRLEAAPRDAQRRLHHDAEGRRALRELRLRPHLGHQAVLGRLLLLEDVYVVVRHPLLPDEHPLPPVDDEVPPLVKGALAHVRQVVLADALRPAVRRLEHHRDPPQPYPRVRDLLLQRFHVGRLVPQERLLLDVHVNLRRVTKSLKLSICWCTSPCVLKKEPVKG